MRSPSIIRINVSKTPGLVRMTLFCLLAPGIICGGAMLGCWPDPLAFLDPFLSGDTFDDAGSMMVIKMEFLFFVSVVVYGFALGSREIQHVSFLGESVLVKLPFSQKTYPIRDIRDYRFAAWRKRFYKLHLDFGYTTLKLKIEDDQKQRIENFIERVDAGSSAPSPALEASPKLSPEDVLASIHARRSRRSGASAILLLAISVAVFASLGYLRWNLELLLGLVVALFIHEAGHLIAMRLFKYTNLKMLFVPLLGALASGESQEQDAKKIAIIAIAGPVFGLASAFAFAALWLATDYQPLYRLAVLSVALNAFNLLPIKPLDGGQFLNEALFSRFPKAEMAYGVLALAVTGFAALKFHSAAFGIIALFVALGLSTRYSFAKLASNLKRDPDFIGGELDAEKTQRVLDYLARVMPKRLKPPQDKALPQTVADIWALATKRHPKPITSALLIGFYVVLVLLAIPFSFGFLQGIGPAY